MISATTGTHRSPSKAPPAEPSTCVARARSRTAPGRCGKRCWPGVTCCCRPPNAGSRAAGQVPWLVARQGGTMTDRVPVGNLSVARVLYDFINGEALPGTDIDPDSFWAGVDKVVTDLTPRNQELLRSRDELQAQIDKWHRLRVIE